ncbi:MAG: hypothetical protein JJU37_01570 [Balneolaceae bacterium]|nr:hypothetical protein [Balneolaceae bacterium]
MPQIPSVTEINEASERIKPYAHRTPVLQSAWFNDMILLTDEYPQLINKVV